MRYVAIVLSAGSGRRMHSSIQKQYMDLEGKPVLYYSLQAFQQSQIDEIILVTGKEDMEYCREQIVEKYDLNKVKKIVPGGAERYDSVFYGLKAAEQADYVLIHDGARPMVDEKIIADSMEAVKEYEACVVGVPVKDTIKVIDEDNYAVTTPNRNTLWQVQTPQSFSYSLVYEAYKKVMEEKVPGITDDAMVVEYATTKRVKLIEGSYENLKITTPEDLEIASIFVKKRKFKK